MRKGTRVIVSTDDLFATKTGTIFYWNSNGLCSVDLDGQSDLRTRQIFSHDEVKELSEQVETIIPDPAFWERLKDQYFGPHTQI